MSGAGSSRRIVAIVMAGHFVAAFAALGMPPFFALILEQSLHSEARYLTGWLYVVPTFFTALSSPWWGRLADRFGKKPLLIRAQLGLAASFLLAGFAPNVGVFLVALVLQGLLGGTFAASNAYLATAVRGAALTRSLTAMQGSARAALVLAPLAIGLWIGIDSPITLYRYLAVLPLVAALLVLGLPSAHDTISSPQQAPASAGVAEATPRQIYRLQLIFVFATVITFPYFIPQLQERFASLSAAQAGLLFGLPHGVYLLAAPLLSRWLGMRRPLLTLAVAFAALALSLAGQYSATSLAGLVLGRLAMGLAMTAGFIGLHALVAGVVRSHSAGRSFGWFESSSKWGAVAAGLGAGAIAALAGPSAPFLIGAVALGIASTYVLRIGASPVAVSVS